jgi:hypothetical protein
MSHLDMPLTAEERRRIRAAVLRLVVIVAMLLGVFFIGRLN